MESLLKRTQTGSLATVGADGQPYITVLNHLYIAADPEPGNTNAAYGCIYFHCALTGRKLENIGHESRVCFSVYEMEQVEIGSHSCNCTVYYDSVLAFGTARIINNHPDKENILNALTAKYAGHNLPTAPGDSYAVTGLVKITISELSGKRSFDNS